MNRHLLLFTVVVATIFTLSACGNKKDTVKLSVILNQGSREESMNEFRKSVSIKDIDKDIFCECVLLGDSIQKLVCWGRYSDAFNSFDALSLEKGCSLKVQECRSDGRSQIYFKNRNFFKKRDYDFFKYIHVEDSYKGAWQVYLLHSLWYNLPCCQHGCYADRTYIYVKDIDHKFNNIDYCHYLTEMYLYRQESHDPQIKLDEVIVFDENKGIPIISKYQDKYFVSVCYWNDWCGLVRELIEITIRDNKVEKLFLVSKENKLEYDKGVRY